MRVAIVGGGAAGLVTAWLLQDVHEVTLYEAAPRLGGHARTVEVQTGRGCVRCETGIRFIFDQTYPTLHALLRCLQLRPRWRTANLTMHWPEQGRVLVLPPRSARHLALLLRPQNLADAVRFDRHLAGLRRLAPDDWARSIEAWGHGPGGSPDFFERFFLPFLAASWGAPVEDMRGFPAADVATVLQRPKGRHGLYEFPGGISEYVNALVAATPGAALRVGAPVVGLRRSGGAWRLRVGPGDEAEYDQVVLASAPWDALKVLDTAPEAAAWAARLRPFRWFDTTIVLHEDPSALPADPRDWSTLNQRFDPERPWTTEWAGEELEQEVFRSWQPAHRPAPAREIERVAFKHLRMDAAHRARQAEIARAQGEGGLWAAGLYVAAADNHESSVASAVTVGRALAPGSPTLARLDAELGAGGDAAPAGPA
jgi:predicted NAD/FAD-binding protein